MYYVNLYVHVAHVALTTQNFGMFLHTYNVHMYFMFLHLYNVHMYFMFLHLYNVHMF
jgi:hypothetical protein